MTQTQATVTVGTVFARSWGYDQTNVDYYEIVSVSATGKTAKARKLRTVQVGEQPTSYYYDRVGPATGDGRFDDSDGCSRCSNHHDGPGWDGHAFSNLYHYSARHDSLTVTPYGDHAWVWDGQPDSQTALGYGH